MINLSEPSSRKLLAEQIKKDIDKFCVDKWNEGPRSHLGASEIGKPCKRELWYKFRWCFYKVHDGRQYRLFQRGHFEEPRFKSYLEGIGCEVQEFDEANINEQDKGKRQIRISACHGHFGGSIDARIKLPTKYGIEENILFLGEYKTSGTGKKFTNLISDGCEKEKYQHFCQQSIYGYKLGLKYAIYIVVNKNDDDLYIEVIELDWNLGKELEEKAEEIIFAKEPPSKISMSPQHYSCNYCDCKEICWFEKSIDKNCRSCKMCSPVENAEWKCEKYNSIVPKEFISQGCNDWKSIL